MGDVPYGYRVAALAVFATAVVGVDLLRTRGRSTRLPEYGVLLLAGLMGAAYGVLNDWITSSISSDYFALGKGIARGGTLQRDAMILGGQAGFSAGVIVGAVWLYVAAKRHDAVPMHRAMLILRVAWLPLLLAGVFAVLLPATVGALDTRGFREALADRLSASQIDRFLLVWWAHLGAYTGGIAGAVIGAMRLWQRRPGD